MYFVNQSVCICIRIFTIVKDLTILANKNHISHTIKCLYEIYILFIKNKNLDE